MPLLPWWLRGSDRPASPPAPAVRTPPTFDRLSRPVVSDAVLEAARRPRQPPSPHPFRLPSHPPGVGPGGGRLAMDDVGSNTMLAWAARELGGYSEGLHFLGYPTLSEMAQRAEYRRIVETTARHMTRKWIRLVSRGDQDKSERIALIEKAMRRLRVQDTFRRAAERDGYFGRGHLFIDLGATDPDELMTSIGDGQDLISRTKIARGSLMAVRSVEPVWCYPIAYNSSDPLSGDWYRPTSWIAMGTQVHASRMLTIVGREVPDMLKPAYSFGGLALTQMAKPYVENWLQVRQAVTDIIKSFSVFNLSTDLVARLGGMSEDLIRRVDLFNSLRDNRGVLVTDKENEAFANISAPLGSLDHLQAQAQEHMASVAATPLVILLGIQPSGLNASSDGEIQVFDDWINSAQETLFRPPLSTILGVVQLSEFGDVDPDIDFEFEPLRSLDEIQAAQVDLSKAQADAARIDAGVISVDEARQRVAGDESSPYQGLDLSGPAPGVPMPEMGSEGFPGGGGPPGGGGGGGDPDAPPGKQAPKVPDKPVSPEAEDEAWEEPDHPRDQTGKFTVKGGVRAVPSKVANAARKFSDEDFRIIKERHHRAGSEPRKRFAEKVSHMGGTVKELLGDHLKSEKRNAVHAAGALKAMATGQKASPEQMSGLRQFGVRILLAGSAMAATGDVTGTTAQVTGSLVHELINHVLSEHALAAAGGAARYVAFAAKKRPAGDEMPVEGDDDLTADDYGLLRDFIDHLATAARDLDVSDERMAELLAGPGAGAEDEVAWQESKHPRDDDGKFGSGGSGGRASGEGGKASLLPTQSRDGQRVQGNGKPLPAHVAKLKIPPAWSDVRFNPDAKGALLVTGKDAKGRQQAIYSEQFAEGQAAAKFARVKELAQKFRPISAQNERNRKSADPALRGHADCMALVMKMGIRPGSDADRGGAVVAYGATTLEGRHVVSTARGGVSLRFVGKKGVAIDLPVDDPELAKMLTERAKKAGEGDRLFPRVSDRSLLEYAHTLDGGGFKTKDFRTHFGTSLAVAAVAKMPAPANAKEYRKRVREVATLVAAKLGNTPTVTLGSYIAPEVFAGWRSAAP